MSRPRPVGRVLTLLELLQSGGTRTVAELADRLGVEGRTVRRYVDQLIDLDVPVESVRGRVVPDAAIKQVGVKRFADSGDVAWLEDARDSSAQSLLKEN